MTGFSKAILRRFVQLQIGLALYGTSMALMIKSSLGLDPWDWSQAWPGPTRRTDDRVRRAEPGRSIRLVRTVIEVTVLGVGWLLGGTVGVGTVLYAVSIGPLAHVLIPLFTVRPPEQVTAPA